jgi:protein-S-isoprenylcysteine O-methyltransferase Ste14
VHLLGASLAVAGGTLLLLCIWEFFARGRGTLSPMDPPRELVITGLYRHVRNPMYLGGATALLGEILLTRSRGLMLMAITWFALVNIFVLAYEEPHLRRTFGASYAAYTARVRRWIPRIRPIQPA